MLLTKLDDAEEFAVLVAIAVLVIAILVADVAIVAVVVFVVSLLTNLCASNACVASGGEEALFHLFVADALPSVGLIAADFVLRLTGIAVTVAAALVGAAGLCAVVVLMHVIVQ